MIKETPNYRLLIIEDQEMFRSLICKHLEGNEIHSLVGEAANGKEGWALCQSLRPDLVLLDLQLPDMDGLDLGKRILSELPGCSILALTNYTDPYTTNQVYEMGMHGYVEKNQPIHVLEEAILTVAEGGLYFTHLVRENRFKMQSDPNAVYKILSQREQEILAWVAEGLSCREVGEKLFICPKTVENHRHRIMKKLGVTNIGGLIRFALDHGITKKIAR